MTGWFLGSRTWGRVQARLSRQMNVKPRLACSFVPTGRRWGFLGPVGCSLTSFVATHLIISSLTSLTVSAWVPATLGPFSQLQRHFLTRPSRMTACRVHTRRCAWTLNQLPLDGPCQNYMLSSNGMFHIHPHDCLCFVTYIFLYGDCLCLAPARSICHTWIISFCCMISDQGNACNRLCFFSETETVQWPRADPGHCIGTCATADDCIRLVTN